MTNTTPDPLYGINVAIFTGDDPAPGTSQDSAVERHRCIDVTSAVDDKTMYQYDPQDLLAAWVQCAGLQARLVLCADGAIRRDAAARGHRCKYDSSGNYEGKYASTCGFWADNRVVDPRTAIEEGTVPTVSFWVPTERATYWVKLLRRWLGEMIAEDLTPFAAAQAPALEHEQVQLTEPSIRKAIP